MPELPEVETVARDLKAWEGRELEALEVRDPKVWFEGNLEPDDFAGKKLLNVGRRGKYLCFQFDNAAIAGHLRMTGKFLPWPSEIIPEKVRESKQIRALFHWKNQESWAFYDTRRFGTLTGLTDLEALWETKGLAPDPVHAPRAALKIFLQELEASTRPIKAFLLDQRVILGVGNIYADEALFRIKAHPLTPARSLSGQPAERLFQEITALFRAAIKARGTSAYNYLSPQGTAGSFQDSILAYGRTGEACADCGAKAQIQVLQVGGRSSHFCPRCQPLRKTKNEKNSSARQR